MTDVKQFRVTLYNHTPYRKVSHEVENGFCEVVVKDGENWAEIKLTESYTPRDGKREVTRTIHATLTAEQRAKLIETLLRLN